MKKVIFSLLVLTVALVATAAKNQPAEGEYVTKTFQVEGMTCGGCEMTVKQALKKKGFSKNIEKISHQDKVAVLKFKKGTLTPELECKVIKTITDLNYKVNSDTDNKLACK